MPSFLLRSAILFLALVFGLTGCGGCGGGDDAPVDPDSASPDASDPDAGTDAMPDAMETEVVQCPTQLPAPTTGDCDVVDGTGTAVVLQGTVLGLGTTYFDGAVVYDGDLITYVGCDPTSAPGYATATRISCGDNVISPGLINAHDHITYNNRAPLPSTAAHDPRRYGHRNEWRDAWPTPPNQYGNVSSNTDGVRWNEIRHVFAGTTSVVGAGHANGMIRNLDDVAAPEFALGFERLQYETFILNDNSSFAHTIPSNCGWNYEFNEREVAALDALVSHASEGIDARSRAEFQCQRTSFGGGQDFVESNTAHVHVIAANADDYYDMQRDGSVLVWSPRSNISLFGNTSQAQVMHRLGGTVAVGTDWTYTGSATMLRELACVDELNDTYLDDAFTDEDIWKMATINGAIAARSEELIGSLTTGKLADIAIFRAEPGETYRAIIAAGDADVALVVRDGDVLYGEDDVVEALASGCETVTVCAQSRRICAQREFNKTFATLAAAVPLAYPAIFCSAPDDEPTCLPSRMNEYDGITATDMDGDGRADANDNCPRTFNPIRPMDNGVQADVDGDGIGDACDPTPVGTDLDMDGIANDTDVCPFVSDPGQLDGDNDDKGDVCDFCPGVANPESVCPAVISDATIYSIKNGTVALGSLVRVTNAIVTGKGSNGFFMQVKAGDAGDMGANYSGIFVFTNSPSSFLNAVAVGNRVTVEGRVTVFNNQTEIDFVTAVTVTNASVEAPPAPVTATAAEVTTGGSRAAQLEGVLVQVGMSNVTAINAPQGEFTIQDASGMLVVDDFFYVPSPAITVGRAFASVTGVLAHRGASKLEPRSAADLVAGAPAILSFAPALSYVAEGQSGVPTIPTALTVTLNGPAPSDTMVPITSTDENVLTVVGGGVTIPMGMSSGQVLVNGLAAGTATLTATLGGMRTADVRVVGATEQPALVSLTPTDPSMFAGTAVTFTVTLDLPAPTGGTSIALAVDPANAGVLPAMVTVPAGQVSTTFDYMDTNMVMSATVSATLGAVTQDATVTITQATNALMINEIDYDQSGTDMTEYVELFNGTGSAYSLTNIELILVNGSGTPAEYRRVPLGPAGSIPSGGYLVIATSAVTVQSPGVRYTPPTANWPTQDALQNGGTTAAPASDGLLLVNTSTMTVIDKLAYEGPVTVTISGFGSVNLVEGTMTSAIDDPAVPQSLSRIPNGTDTNNAATDWAATTTITPGAPNVP